MYRGVLNFTTVYYSYLPTIKLTKAKSVLKYLHNIKKEKKR